MTVTFFPGRRVHWMHALLAVALLAASGAAAATGTLDKARDSGKLVIGHYKEAAPFAYLDGGKPGGYAIAVCDKVAQAVKAQLNMPALALNASSTESTT